MDVVAHTATCGLTHTVQILSDDCLRTLLPTLAEPLLGHTLCARIAVPKPFRFYPCPSRHDSLKTNCDNGMFGNCLEFVSTNLWFHFGKEICDFRLSNGRFVRTEI